MAFVLADRVRETTATTGTGAVTLGGAVIGFQTFSAIGNANTTYYAIAGQGTSEWEVGIGTYTASGTTLSRDTVLASSNSGSLVNFSAGTKDVFCDYPAGRAAYLDTTGNILNVPTLDATNIDVTNVRALDGTAAFSIANTTGVVSIDDTKFTLQDNTDNTKKALFELSGITTATTRTYTLPNVTGTLATISTLTQTFSGTTTFSASTVTVGSSTNTATYGLGTGATGSGNTKTVNIGTAGVSGSTTTINIGSAVSSSTTNATANGTWTYSGSVGVGVTPSTYKFDVAGVANATTVRASNGIVVNSQTVSADYTIASGDNGLSAGPVTVSSGITVTVSSGSVWTVV
jgi:hypothetical protein